MKRSGSSRSNCSRSSARVTTNRPLQSAERKWEINPWTAISRFIRAMIRSGHYPRAVFAENDLIALGVIQGVKASGLKVPEDIAVVGFDDIPFAAFPEVQLSTILQPKYRMGRRAVEIILQQIEAVGEKDSPDGSEGGQSDGDGKPERIFLAPELVVRGSS